MRPPGTVHIVDDDDRLRSALDSLVRTVGFAAHQHASAQAFLEAERPDGPGCIVSDIRMPGMSGLDFQAHLLRTGERLPIILMTGHGDIPMSVQAMKAGAVDFLPKPFRDQDMLDAVAFAIEQDRTRRVSEHEAADLNDRFATLSARERQVMDLVTSGRMNKQVAAELELSEITVKIHRSAAMRKMGARTLTDLVRMVVALREPRSYPGAVRPSAAATPAP